MKKIIPKRWSNDSGYGYHIPKNGLHLFDTPYKAFANLFERIKSIEALGNA